MDPFKGLLDPFKERFLLAGAGDPLGGPMLLNTAGKQAIPKGPTYQTAL